MASVRSFHRYRGESSFTMSQFIAILREQLPQVAPSQTKYRVTEIPSERTIRFYTANKLVDKPVATEGAHARYGYRHLLQVLSIKYLQSQYLPLVKIRSLVENVSNRDLELLIPEISTVTAAHRGFAREDRPVVENSFLPQIFSFNSRQPSRKQRLRNAATMESATPGAVSRSGRGSNCTCTPRHLRRRMSNGSEECCCGNSAFCAAGSGREKSNPRRGVAARAGISARRLPAELELLLSAGSAEPALGVLPRESSLLAVAFRAVLRAGLHRVILLVHKDCILYTISGQRGSPRTGRI